MDSEDKLAKFKAFQEQSVSSEKVPPLAMGKFLELGGDVDAFKDSMKDEADPDTLSIILSTIFNFFSKG